MSTFSSLRLKIIWIFISWRNTIFIPSLSHKKTAVKESLPLFKSEMELIDFYSLSVLMHIGSYVVHPYSIMLPTNYPYSVYFYNSTTIALHYIMLYILTKWCGGGIIIVMTTDLFYGKMFKKESMGSTSYGIFVSKLYRELWTWK